MASSLGITADEANSNALSTNYPIALRMCSSICFESLNTCTKPHSRAMIESLIVVHKLNIFQVVCPDAKSALTGRFA